MDKLEEMKAKFKDKTAGGLEFIILEVYTDSMQVMVKSRDSVASVNRWVLCLYNLGGESFGTTGNLVPIRPVIDYSKLPVDVLCEVALSGQMRGLRYSSGDGSFFCGGRDSNSHVPGMTKQAHTEIEIVGNPIRANIGNKVSLLPDNIMLRVWSGKDTYHTGLSQMLRGWSDIIYYQILGER